MLAPTHRLVGYYSLLRPSRSWLDIYRNHYCQSGETCTDHPSTLALRLGLPEDSNLGYKISCAADKPSDVAVSSMQAAS